MAAFAALAPVIKEFVNTNIDKIMQYTDGKKYVENVNNYSAEISFDDILEIIKEDETMPTKEKVKLMLEVKKEKEAMQYRHGKDVQQAQEKSAKIAIQIVSGVLTAGVSMIPAIVKYAKEDRLPEIVAEQDDSQQELLEEGTQCEE